MNFSFKNQINNKTILFIKKTLIKTISWRILSTILTVIIILIGTGSLDLAIKLGLLDTAIKTVAFFGHEIILERKFSKKK